MFTILATCLGEAGQKIHLMFTEDKRHSGCISVDARGFNDWMDYNRSSFSVVKDKQSWYLNCLGEFSFRRGESNRYDCPGENYWNIKKTEKTLGMNFRNCKSIFFYIKLPKAKLWNFRNESCDVLFEWNVLNLIEIMRISRVIKYGWSGCCSHSCKQWTQI